MDAGGRAMQGAIAEVAPSEGEGVVESAKHPHPNPLPQGEGV
jgi:hypothetical protein